MSKGLLAWWRRRIVSRGLAGAALFAVPVAVAALIGFGTSLSGVAGGITAFTNGPDAVPAAAQTARPSNLNRAVVALANRPSRTGTSNSNAGGGTNGSTSRPGDGVSVNQGTGESGSGGGGQVPASTVDVAPGGTTTSSPGISVPDTGGVTETTTTSTDNAVNQVGGAVNNLLGGVGQTLNGLLNGKN
jgi:hypothetical protein